MLSSKPTISREILGVSDYVQEVNKGGAGSRQPPRLREREMNDKDNEVKMKRYEIENYQDWRGEITKIPFIQFPADWLIQMIPPFSDAVVRFRVRLPSGKEKSIYLDSRNSIGYMPYTYWEVYPVHGDVGRCEMNDIQELLSLIANEAEAKDA